MERKTHHPARLQYVKHWLDKRQGLLWDEIITSSWRKFFTLVMFGICKLWYSSNSMIYEVNYQISIGISTNQTGKVHISTMQRCVSQTSLMSFTKSKIHNLECTHDINPKFKQLSHSRLFFYFVLMLIPSTAFFFITCQSGYLSTFHFQFNFFYKTILRWDIIGNKEKTKEIK